MSSTLWLHLRKVDATIIDIYEYNYSDQLRSSMNLGPLQKPTIHQWKGGKQTTYKTFLQDISLVWKSL